MVNGHYIKHYFERDKEKIGEVNVVDLYNLHYNSQLRAEARPRQANDIKEALVGKKPKLFV